MRYNLLQTAIQEIRKYTPPFAANCEGSAAGVVCCKLQFTKSKNNFPALEIATILKNLYFSIEEQEEPQTLLEGGKLYEEIPSSTACPNFHWGG